MYCFSFTLPARQGQHRFACNCCFRHAPLPSGLYWILPQTGSPRPAAYRATCTVYNLTILRGISWSHKTNEAPLYAAPGQGNVWGGQTEKPYIFILCTAPAGISLRKSMCESEKAPVVSPEAGVTRNEGLWGRLGWPCSISGGGGH